MRLRPLIHNSGSTPLASTTPCPTKLSDATTTRDNFTQVRGSNQGCLKQAVLFLIESLAKPFREDRSLNNEHTSCYAIGAVWASPT